MADVKVSYCLILSNRMNKTLQPASIITRWFKSHFNTISNPATVENGNPVEVFCLSSNTFSSVFCAMFFKI